MARVDGSMALREAFIITEYTYRVSTLSNREAQQGWAPSPWCDVVIDSYK
jgi:hypothetical protein